MNPTKPVARGSASAEPTLSTRQPASSAFAARFQLEQPHWKAVLDHVEEAQTALLIVDLFERHPHLQAAHPAVYLRACRRKHLVLKARRRWSLAVGACRWTVSTLIRLGHKASGFTRKRIAQDRQTSDLQWPTLIIQES